MTKPELVHHAVGTRTKSSHYRSIPSPRNANNDNPRTSWKEQLRKASITISILLVVALTMWGALTYYNARRNSPSNVLANTVERIYTIGYQNRAKANIEKKKKSEQYTMDNMLIEANPFGTNTTSLYAYFVTPQLMSVSYTVSAPETNYPSYTHTVSTLAQRGRTHEFQVVGLVPSAKNVITFTMTDVDGNSQTRQYTYNMGDLLGNEPIQLSVKNLQQGTPSDVQSPGMNGLYAVMPQNTGRTNFVYMYDSNGILRGEIPLKNSPATRFISVQDQTCYAVSTTQFACVDKLGAVQNFFNFDGRYRLYGDFTTDSDGNIIAIATNGSTHDRTKEVGTYIVRINILNGRMRVLANLATLLNSYRTTTVGRTITADGTSADSAWNWLDLDSIAALDNQHFLLSSRETSSILTLDVSDSPSITSIIGPASLWNDPKYSYLVMKKDGNFADFAGQNDIQVSNITSSGYTLTLFNNNYAYSPSNPTFNWTNAIPSASQRFQATTSEAHSYVYTYQVNTQTHTYSMVSSLTVPYTALNGNAHFSGNALLTTDTQAGTWTLWHRDGTPLIQYDTHGVNNGDSTATPLNTLYRVQYMPVNR
ncbi:aryl-sulfate sulfotransferase [Alloscardovia omnicolens]|uniref:aryl-sulfate sulfotransferase n=1 Tax=Alloscardovia omnicolens TaxID=419015 RepID=UPI003A6940DF